MKQFIVLLLWIFLSGCANKPTFDLPLFLDSYDDFRPGPEGGVDLIWISPTVSTYPTIRAAFEKYDNVLLDRIYVVLDESTKEHLNEEEITLVTDYLMQQLKERLRHRFQIVNTPGTNTIRISIALSNIETANPILATTSSVLPIGFGISTIAWVATGEHIQTGNATAEVLVSESQTDAPLIAIIDRRSGNKDFSTITDNTDDVKDAINDWVDQLGNTFLPISNEEEE